MKQGVLPDVLKVKTITRTSDLKPGDVVMTMELHVVGPGKLRSDWVYCTGYDHMRGSAQLWPYVKHLGMGQQCIAKVLNVKRVTRHKGPPRMVKVGPKS